MLRRRVSAAAQGKIETRGVAPHRATAAGRSLSPDLWKFVEVAKLRKLRGEGEVKNLHRTERDGTYPTETDKHGSMSVVRQFSILSIVLVGLLQLVRNRDGNQVRICCVLTVDQYFNKKRLKSSPTVIVTFQQPPPLFDGCVVAPDAM